MFRFLVFLLVVLGLGILFAWVADNPGTIFLKWEWLAAQMGRPGEEVGIPLTLAFTLLVGLIVAIMIIWSILRTLFGAPSMLSRFFDNRKREKGYKALSQGLIAASSGDASTARKLTKESKRLLGQEPLVALLGTQTAILEGKRDEARENFKTMLADDSTKMVALRGLFLEAERQGEPEAARHYAEEAAKTDASLPWAGNARLRYAASDGDWDSAIRTLDSNRSAGLIDKIAAKRQRAVLLTGKAMAKEAENPDYALKLSKEAHKLAKDLVPAATTFARVSTRLGDPKTATKIIEAAWKTEPHPELAEAYAAITSGASVQERLERAKKLASYKPEHPESKLALAIAAIDATEWQEARDALESILTTNPTERAYLLMADIEEGQHGDKGRMRDWLARAVRAPADPAWVAGNYVSDEWLPVSPTDGEIDAFEWKVPVQQLGNDTASVMTLEELKAEAVPINPVVEVEPETEEAETEEVEDAVVITADDAKTDEIEETAKEESEENSDASKMDDFAKSVTVTATAATAAVAVSETKSEEDDSEESETEQPEPQNDNDEKADNEAQAAMDAEPVMPNKLAAEPEKDNADNTVDFPLKRRPDDPGPHPDKEPPKKGFKLF
jgi:HemY protein